MNLSNITIKFSRRKTLGLYVFSHGVEVRAPSGTPHSVIDEFINRRKDWILKHTQSLQLKTSERYQLIHGSKIPLLGKTRELIVKHAHVNRAQERDDRIILEVANNSKSSIEQAFRKLLLTKAKQHLPGLTKELATKAGLDHLLTDVVFRRTKTKWGHCTSKGKIQYNWLIMMAPENIIYSLVAHEVAHLAHLNHSKEFWALVAKLDPNYKGHKRWLKDNGHRFDVFS